jgi:hypothetical protein
MKSTRQQHQILKIRRHTLSAQRNVHDGKGGGEPWCPVCMVPEARLNNSRDLATARALVLVRPATQSPTPKPWRGRRVRPKSFLDLIRHGTWMNAIELASPPASQSIALFLPPFRSVGRKRLRRCLVPRLKLSSYPIRYLDTCMKY